MKKIILTLLLLSSIMLTSCTKKYTVTFDPHIDELEVFEQKVSPGKKIVEPNMEHSVIEAYRFLGWYHEDKQFDFNQEINEDIRLYAKWKRPSLALSLAYTPRMDVSGEKYLSYTHIFIAKIDELVKTIYEPIHQANTISEYAFSNPLFLKGNAELNTIGIYGAWINDYIYQCEISYPYVFEPEGYYIIYATLVKDDADQEAFSVVYNNYTIFPISSKVYDPNLPIEQQYDRLKHYLFPNYLPPLQ